MTMRRLFDILIASVGIAVLGFALHGLPTVALAFDGSAPVEVTNGDVSLTCADDNRLLGKTTGNVDCLEILPDAVAFDRYSLATKLSLYGATQYDPVYCIGVSILALDIVPSGAPAFCGCAYETIDNLAYGRIYDSGSAICTKAGTAISLHDRVKVNASGVLETALDSEVAVGVATVGATDVATVVSIEMGQQTSPVVQAVQHIATMQTRSNSAGADRYFPVMGAPLDTDVTSLVKIAATTVMPEGYITSPISCWCDDAVTTAHTVKIELCINDGADCDGSDTDIVSDCTISAGETSCTDSTWTAEYTVEADEDFYYFVDRSGGSGCQYYQCRFSYTQSEY